MQEQPRILVVDDDPDILEAVKTVLESRDYIVSTAKNGEEGLDMIRKSRPDLLILDLLMPKKDGFAVCRELKEHPKYADLPIVILTSVREDASRRRYELETGLSLDVDDYVEKPVAPLDLLHRVEVVLKRKGKRP